MTERAIGGAIEVEPLSDTGNAPDELRDASRGPFEADGPDLDAADDDGWDDSDLDTARWLSRGFDRRGMRVIQRAIGSGRAREWFGERVTIGEDDERHKTIGDRADRESRAQAEQRAKVAAARAARHNGVR